MKGSGHMDGSAMKPLENKNRQARPEHVSGHLVGFYRKANLNARIRSREDMEGDEELEELMEREIDAWLQPQI